MKILRALTGISIRQKIVTLALVQVLVTALAFGSLTLVRSEQQIRAATIDLLAKDADAVSASLAAAFDQLKYDSDISVLASSVKGLVDARLNGGRDRVHNAPEANWNKAVSDLFLSILLNRPHYRQYRLIDAGPEAQEIIRLDRTPEGALVLRPTEQLQSKSNEEYMLDARHLAPGETYLSRVTLNRENGIIDDERLPAIRLIAPVVRDGQVAAYIVINADYRAMLDNAFRDLPPGTSAYVINSQGDIFEHHADQQDGRLSFRANPINEPINAQLMAAEATDADSLIYAGEDWLTQFTITTLPFVGPNRTFHSALSIPTDILRAELVEARRATTLLSLGALILFGALSLFVAHSATRPLARLTRLLEKAKVYDDLKDLPIEANDEVGKLTHAFRNLSRSLKASEVQSQVVLENILDGIIILNERGKILHANPAALQLFGHDAASLVGQDVKVLLPQEIAVQHDGFMARYFDTGTSSLFCLGREVQGKKADGTLFDMELSLSEARVGRVRYFTGIMRDISERKRVARLKTEFVSTVNHELRTPLTNIRAALGMLQLNLDAKLDRKCKRLLQLSIDNGTTLSKLVDDMLDLQKIEAGRMDFKSEYTELRTFLAAIVASHEAYAESFGVKLVYHDNARSGLVNLDPLRLRQVIVNLLSNAVKFSPAGGRVELSLSHHDTGWLRIAVRDHGKGIPKEFRPSIFEQFTQADGSNTRTRNGSGLGLSIAQKFVAAFGGSLTFDSVEGEGTTFFVDLPMVDENSMRRAQA